MRRQYFIGIDLGGTNFRLAILDKRFRIITKESWPTSNFNNKDSLLNAIEINLFSLIRRTRLLPNQILGIGVGLPGPVDPKKGIIHFLPNIKGWRKVRLKDILEKRLKMNVFIDNDVNLMSLGEYKLGAARGATCAVCITLGTGVGGGIVINGEILRGKSNVTGEIGHLPLNEDGPSCNCGGRACLEAYVGNKRLLNKAKRLFHHNITLEEVTDLANRGEKVAIEFWRDAGQKIGLALTAVVNLLNPDRIVIGGGVANAGKVLFDQIRRTIKERAMPTQANDCKVVKALLGDNAGLIGAAILVQRNLMRNEN